MGILLGGTLRNVNIPFLLKLKFIISLCAHACIYFSMSYNGLLPLFIFVHTLSWFGWWEPLQFGFCVFWPAHQFLHTFWLFATRICTWLTLYFPCSSPKFSHFSEEQPLLSGSESRRDAPPCIAAVFFPPVASFAWPHQIAFGLNCSERGRAHFVLI